MKRWRSIILPLFAAFALVFLAACSGGATTPAVQEEAVEEEAPAEEAPAEAAEEEAVQEEAPMEEEEAASTEPIKIGQLSDLTSTFTPWGVQVRDGMALAAQEINEAGGVNGRMIEIIVQDSENDGDIGVDRFERLVEDGVVAVGGPISSGVGAPVAATAEQLQIPLFLVKSGTDAALTRDSRFTFRTCLPAAPMVAGPVLQYAQEQGFTRVGAIVADYPWGHAIESAIENTFEGSGIDYTIEVAPVPPSTDFTPYVRAMADFDAQMIIATGHPPGNAAIVTLSADLHDVPVSSAWTPPDLTVGGLQDLAIGRVSDFSCADYFSDSYADLTRRYLAFSDNKFMSDDAVAGYAIVQMVAQAVGEVGDDPVAIAEYMHANEFNMPGYAHPLSWTEWGELAKAQPSFTIFSEGPAPEGLNEAGDWWFELLTKSDPLTPYEPGAPAEAASSEPPASTEPIKIGQLSDLTSTFTPWGLNVRDGMALAAQEINEAGGVNGRMVEIIVQDSENDGDIGVDRFERLVEDGVVAVGGILSSGVGAPVAATAEQLQMPLFLVKSGTDAALTRDSRFTFRTCLPAAPMTAGPVLQYAQEQGFTKVGAIVADYPWGQAFKSAMENTFEGSGIEYTIEVAPVPPSTDFTPYVRAMADFDADMIAATGHPPGNAAIVTLSADLHDVPVTGAWTPPDLTVGGLQDLAIGRVSDFSCADYFSDSYADLARRYLAFSDNQFMSDDAVAGYAIVQMVAQAVGEVGDDPVAIAEYLHANEFNMPGYAHPLSWTEWGELAQSQPIFTIFSEGPAPEGLNEAGDWWFELLTKSDPLTPYEPGQ